MLGNLTNLVTGPGASVPAHYQALLLLYLGTQGQLIILSPQSRKPQRKQ